MKAFEKWWEEHSRASRYHCGDYVGTVAENAWRAALKWFYTKLDHSQEHGELKDLIEQEMEGEKCNS